MKLPPFRIIGRVIPLLAAVLSLAPSLASSRPAQLNPPTGDLSDAAIAQSEALFFHGDFDAAIEVLNLSSRSRFESLPVIDRVALVSQAARVQVIRDSVRQQPARHRETLEQLLALRSIADKMAPSPIHARYLYAAATTYLFNTDSEAAVQYCSLAQEMFLKSGDQHGEADARAFLIMVRQGRLRRAGNHDGMIALIPELEGEIAFAAQAGNLLALAYNQRHLARIFVEQLHDPQRALSLFRDALASRMEAGFRPYVPPSYLSLGDAYLAGGDPRNAEAMWRRALETADDIGFIRHQVLARMRLGDLHRDQSDISLAEELYGTALRIATEGNYGSVVDDIKDRVETLASASGGAEGGRLVRLTFHQADDRYPAWNPRSGDLAFESRRDGNWNIYIRDAGGTVRRLTDHAANDRYPAWHPDGSHIVFQSDRGAGAQLYLLALGSGQSTQLTEVQGEPAFPDWSPDGRTIAFSLNDGDRIDLYSIDVETKSARQLTDHAARDVWPRWSPDGRNLAFFSRRDTGGEDDEIYLYAAASGAIRRLTSRGGHDFAPAWSPTGAHLATARIGEGNRRWIGVLDLEGAEVARLDAGMFRATEPSWAPDGSEIAFAARRDGAYDIYLFRVEN